MKNLLLAAALVAAASIGAGAQVPFEDDELLVPPPEKAPWLLDWGATVTAAGLYREPGTPDDAFAGASGVLWTRLSLPASWQLYARFRGNTLGAVLPWPEDGLEMDAEWELNAAYLQLTESRGGITFTAGRKPFLLGSGLILSGPGDGAELALANPWFNAKALMFYTGLLNPYFSSYAMNAEDADKGPQRYFGAYSVGTVLFGTEGALLGAYQNDFKTDEGSVYASWYSGFRLKGVILGGEGLLEWYQEHGRSPSGDTVGKIDAYGGIGRYQRTFAGRSAPKILIQYALASGDKDRTIGAGAAGNADGKDTAFQAFGELTTGSVFSPAFSNVHIALIEGSFNPLALLSARSRSSVALRYFYYAKHRAAGVVNGDDAPRNDPFLGQGADLLLKWSPFIDLSAFMTVGAFLPGTAFPRGEDPRFAVSAGLSLTL